MARKIEAISVQRRIIIKTLYYIVPDNDTELFTEQNSEGKDFIFQGKIHGGDKRDIPLPQKTMRNGEKSMGEEKSVGREKSVGETAAKNFHALRALLLLLLYPPPT